MPGPVSDSYQAPPEDGPYVPLWCYGDGPKMCPCGHHEGYHNDAGQCIQAEDRCGCTGLPADCAKLAAIARKYFLTHRSLIRGYR
jgi:hypothetical protein